MTVGLAQGMNEINNECGNMVVTVKTALKRAASFKAFIDGKLDSELTTLGYSAADITLLRALATDLNNLYLVSVGQATQAAVNDFFFNAKKAAGVLLPA